MSEARWEPQVVDFAGCRVIGLRYAGKNENGEVPGLWAGPTGFGARMAEVVPPAEGTYLNTGKHPGLRRLSLPARGRARRLRVPGGGDGPPPTRRFPRG